MQYGIPFPDIYDWTWGEIIDHINCRTEARRVELREEANMYFRTAALIAKMVGGNKGEQYEVTDEYSFLWTDEELADMKRQKIWRKFAGKTVQKGDGGNG